MAGAAAKSPETLWQLGVLLVRASVKGLAIGLVFRLLVGLTLGFGAFLAHTWLLVAVNEGFNEDVGYLTDILALRGWRFVTGTVVWGLASYLCTTLFFRALGRGPIRLLRDLFTTHRWVFGAFRASGLVGVPLVLLGMAGGLLVGTVLSSRAGAAELAIAVSLSVAMQGSGLLLVAAALGWSDLQRVAGREERARMPVEWLVLLQVGGMAGLLRAVAVPFQPAGGWLVALGLVGAAVLFLGAAVVVRRAPGAAAVLLAAAVAGAVRFALADDGGWQEAGGTFGDWIGSEGALTAMILGLGPFFGVTTGFFWGSLLPWLPYDLLPELQLGEDGLPVPEGEGKGAEAGMADLPQDLKDLKDLITGFLGTTQGAGAVESLLGRMLGLSGSADEAIEAYADWLANNVHIGPGGMVSYTDDAARAAHLDDMLTGVKLQGWMKTIGDAATVVGVAFDAFDNIYKGDDWYYGIGKASGAGALMAKLGEKNPGLAVMEFANFLAFGGSKASDCISPTKNISGGFNVVVDTLVDQANGTDVAVGRMRRGDYGENVKNLADASAIAGEYWADPDTVGKELSDFVTEERTWDDMYDQSHEVWKPPEGAWLPKRVACAGGELATDAVIKAGELTARGAQMAGDATQRVLNFFGW